MQQKHRNTAMRRHSLTSAITITLALGLAGPALAQQAAPADPQQAATAQELDVVTVTANKRTENIREVATAVTKLSAEQLENINATQMSDYANYVPGLQIQDSGSPGQTQVSMRGIAALSPGSTVGTYVDEAPLGSNSLYQQATLFTLDLLPYDIDSIEVLRGPQGTLYGAGAMGGLIKYVMKKPDTTQNEFRVGMGIADTQGAGGNSFNYRAGGNLVLAQDEVALRASFASNEPNGYVDNLVNGREDINDASQFSGRASILFKNDKASVQFALMKQKIDSPNNSTIALDPTTHDDIYGLANFVVVDEAFKKDIENYALTVDYDLGWANLVSATSYSDVFTSITTDQTYTYGDYTTLFGLPGGSAYLTNDLRLKQFTQEVRLSSKADAPFEWLLGAFYDDERGDNHQFVPLTQFDGSPLPEPFNSIVGSLGDLYLPSTYEETAVFGNAAYKFNDWFKLGAGLRWAQNKQEFTQDVVAGLLAPIGTEFNTSEEDVVTWSVTPQFQVTKDVMVYGKVSTGYQPGGPNIVAVGLPRQVDSSTLTSYEIGMKSAFADSRVLLDVVGYQIHWEDIQVASLVNGVSGLVNGGEATSQGLEIAANFRPIDGLTLGLNAAFNDSNIDEDFPTIVVPDGAGPGADVLINTGLKGDRMPYVPDLTWSATADYYLPLTGDWGLNVGGGYRFVDDRITATTQRQAVAVGGTVVFEEFTPGLNIDSYQALDLYLSVSNAHWSVRGYMKNAFDERAYSTMSDITNQVTGVTHHTAATPIMPRTFGLEVDYRF
ncbi:TonB-dependent receptor [Noviluteimonas gilva]|uniref:TonB-dependent receptor plug domain-containing protein n=1 Tax=Noviluteimonas gilva TaxID=2682097 RepID=A0A7C9LLM8_9GAMM|nr:TonB-dependent receptor plug domain-containing protein [Lysobacter gilvus]MUV13403.1 TonB-dependent receptor plug domain-containing protein [Lysobacter gilvus]